MDDITMWMSSVSDAFSRLSMAARDSSSALESLVMYLSNDDEDRNSSSD